MGRPTKNEALLRDIINQIADALAARLANTKPSRATKASAPTATAKKKRNISPEGKARMRAALKKRWAEYRKAKAAA